MIYNQRQNYKNNSFAEILSVSIIFALLAIMINFKNKTEYMQTHIRSFSVEQPEIQIDQESFKCLRRAVFFEVRKNSYEDMVAVANVIFNRIKSKKYPDTVCSVISQSGQFEFVSLGLNNTKSAKEVANKNILEYKAWKTANEVARVYLTSGIQDLTNGSIAYHANTMKKPSSTYWKKMKITLKTNLHTFYSPK